MTDRQRLAKLRAAQEHLKDTTQGHVQWVKGGRKGGHWKEGMKLLNELAADLRPDPIPQLGPVHRNGKSVLLHDLTHATTGILYYPAFDDAFSVGTVIIAPEDMTVHWKLSGANPGEAFYTIGKSKIQYWFGHLDRAHPIGVKFKKGDAIGKVAVNHVGGGPHVHVGVNIEKIAGQGKQLKHHTNYTHGAPLIGVQLKALLSV